MPISGMPPIYPNESFAHWCARFAEIWGFPHISDVPPILLGSRPRTIPHDFPAKISYFITKALPSGHPWSEKEIIFNHTHYPYIAPFLSTKRVNTLLAKMKGNHAGQIYTSLGLRASLVQAPDHLRYCPRCIDEQYKEYREPYWLRYHQASGVLICAKHNHPLHTAPIAHHAKSIPESLITADQALRTPQAGGLSEYKSLSIYHNHLLRIAEDTEWLFENGFHFNANSINWQERYKIVLQELGYATFSGQLRARQLINHLNNYYTPPFLKYFNACLETSSDDNWVTRLVNRKNRFSHPLLHMLLVHSLGYRIAEFVKQPMNSKKQYFLSGPWLCLNKTCHYYQKKMINSYVLTYSEDSGRPSGQFSCPHCQMVYTRIGPDQSLKDREKVSKYVSFGPVWEDALRSVWHDPKHSLRGIARKLGVDTGTVKRHALRLELEFPRPHSRQGRIPKAFTGYYRNSKIEQDFEQERNKRRNSWLSAKEEAPTAGFTELKKQNYAVTTWLWRHDREWLKNNRPEPKRPQKTINNRVDWDIRDLSYAVSYLQGFVSSIGDESHRPRRLSRSAIAKVAQIQSSLEQNQKKLPLTSLTVSHIQESNIEYAVRRIWWVARQPMSGSAIRWRLVRHAGVGRLKHNMIVEKNLDTCISWLNSGRKKSPDFRYLKPIKKIFALKQL